MSIATSTTKLICVASLLLCANAFGACDFDTDDADSPDFMNRIIDCEQQSKAKPRAKKNRLALQPQSSMVTARLIRSLAWLSVRSPRQVQ